MPRWPAGRKRPKRDTCCYPVLPGLFPPIKHSAYCRRNVRPVNTSLNRFPGIAGRTTAYMPSRTGTNLRSFQKKIPRKLFGRKDIPAAVSGFQRTCQRLMDPCRSKRDRPPNLGSLVLRAVSCGTGPREIVNTLRSRVFFRSFASRSIETRISFLKSE